LKIVSADGRVYQSDMVEVRTTPPIDTLYYTTDNTEVNIFTATHDPANNTRYYRWDFTETYIYETPRTTNFIYNGSIKYISQRVVSRTPDQYINLCYDTDTATSIILNSSAKLARDVINNNPITQIPSVSEKILHRYSILVKQYALTSEAYNFWQNLKKNTEQLGSIFDALPSEVNGNIHCVSNPSEPVIGYMSVCSVSQKRIFIDRTELPVWPYILPTCNVPGMTISWLRQQGIPVALTNGVDIPVAPIGSGFDKVHQDSVYSVSVREYSCVDCRYHNFGTTLKPTFWK